MSEADHSGLSPIARVQVKTTWQYHLFIHQTLTITYFVLALARSWRVKEEENTFQALEGLIFNKIVLSLNN